MSFKTLVNIMSYNDSEYVVGWSFNGLYDSEQIC